VDAGGTSAAGKLVGMDSPAFSLATDKNDGKFTVGRDVPVFVVVCALLSFLTLVFRRHFLQGSSN
jgi:hypothetical protein